MVNFGPLTAEIGSGVWGTPTNLNGFCVLAALLHGIYSSGRQPNFTALNRGRQLCLAGRPSGWALAHILVLLGFSATLRVSVVPRVIARSLHDNMLGCQSPSGEWS